MDGVVVVGGAPFWNFRRIARESLLGDGSMDIRVAEFRKRIGPGLYVLLAQERDRKSKTYEEWITGKDYLLGYVFAGIVNGKPKLVIEKVAVDPMDRDELKFNVIRTEDRIEPVSYYAAGYADAIQAGAAVAQYSNVGPERAAERIIRAGIALAPESVGPPVAIVRIEAKGATWFRRPGFCPE